MLYHAVLLGAANRLMHVVEDCCASWTQEMHEFAIKLILPHFGEITSSGALIADMNA